ncbi:cupin domain-containing protein [Peribacillus cavernae]|uniref:Cupin domain-containing protein n=1 Tax=Peribacillus cavernae TaxID=1674310 RepID=A0A433HWP4_9BACI|nr:2,4'-dihydroxyacetophenone dioxygenase family protein [Peribacillus cavernae]MDQ0218141.1 quercetin dioxygenase-like cupin family protein [Peribacillus cavernae]RUQ32707.1 cupin domain-containing protein [Peribacillus cavernae]
MVTDLNSFTEQFQLSDQAININDIPWIPQSDRVWFKPLRFDLTTGSWINLLKVKPGGAVNRHRHTGGKVMAYTLQGQWRYLEREWVATAGSYVFEPPGDIHTLLVDGDEEMITLFILEGSIQYLDDNDQVIKQDDVFSKMKLYYDYCEQNNIPIKELRF